MIGEKNSNVKILLILRQNSPLIKIRLKHLVNIKMELIIFYIALYVVFKNMMKIKKIKEKLDIFALLKQIKKMNI